MTPANNRNIQARPQERMTMGNMGKLLAHMAVVPCALAGLQAVPLHAATMPDDMLAHRVYVTPGTAPWAHLADVRAQARAAGLRATYLASGHKDVRSTAPAITGGAVTAATLTVGQAGQYPSITFSYQTDTPGLNSVYFTFTSPNGEAFYAATFGEPAYTTSGTTSFANIGTPGLWSQPGTWTLASVTVLDNAGASTTYDAKQVATLFTGVSYSVVNNGLVDGTPPRLKGGKLVNDAVSLSGKYPLLKVKLSGTDAGSGLQIGYVIISPPGNPYAFYEDVPLPLPVAKADIQAYTVFSPYDPTGTWNIVGYAVCDFAYNCTGSTAQSDIIKLLGTDTFTVTQ
jgi:hypothetical protein